MQRSRPRAALTASGRFACLLAILTLFGCTIFGVSGAFGRGDQKQAGTPTLASGPTATQLASSSVAGTPTSFHESGPPTKGAGSTQHAGPLVGSGPLNGGGPATGGGQGSGDNGPPYVGDGGGNGHNGPSGGDQGGQSAPQNGDPNPGSGSSTPSGGGALAIRPIAVGPIPSGGGGTGGGHDHGSGHSVCDTSGVCHEGDNQQPSTVPLTPSSPATVTPPTTKTHNSPSPSSTGTFSITGESLVTTSSGHPGNPGANLAGAGSLTGPRAGAAAARFGSLAAATAALGPHAGTGGSSGLASSALARLGAGRLLNFGGVSAGAILQIVNVVPSAVWIAIGALVLLVSLTGGAALLERRRARNSEGQLERAKAVAKTDPLTGVLNRRGFTEAVDRELARARRHGRPFVLAYVDVRGLKAVNDTEGHLAGDELLKGVARLLSESARADDVVGRIGGDELGLLLVEQAGNSATSVTNRIKAQVAARRAELGLRTRWDLTVGTAAFPDDGGTFDELLDAADRRLYEQRGIALAEGRA